MNAFTTRAALNSRGTILHVNRVGFLGGVERVILTLASGSGAFAYESVVACPADGELARAVKQREIDLAPCDFLRMRATSNPAVLINYPFAWRRSSQQILETCERLDVKLIHAHHPVGVIYASRAARALKLPVIFHVHEILPARPLYALALRYAARFVDKFICVSEAGRQMLEALSVTGDRVSVVHNGVDPSFLRRRASATPSLVEGPGPHIGVFGVIEPRKGQHVFLEAAAIVARRFPQARFYIVGPLALADKASYHKKVTALAERPEIRGRVIFAGFQEDVRAWMEAMDVVTLASVAHESLSMVLLESLTLGRPTIGTQVGGAAEAIRDGSTGLLVPPENPQALASAMARILDGDGERLGRAAAEDAEIRFAPEKFCQQVCRIYDELLGYSRGSI